MKPKGISLVEVTIAAGLFGMVVTIMAGYQGSQQTVLTKSRDIKEILTLREALRTGFDCAATLAASGFACTGAPVTTRRADGSVQVADSGTKFREFQVTATCNNGNFDFTVLNTLNNRSRSLYNNIPLVCVLPPSAPTEFKIPVRPVCSNNIAGVGPRKDRWTYQWYGSYLTTQAATNGLAVKLFAYGNTATPAFVVNNSTASDAIRKALLQDFELPGSILAGAPNGEYQMVICDRNQLAGCRQVDCGTYVDIAVYAGAMMHGWAYHWNPANSWWRPSAAETAAVGRKEICYPKGGIEDIWTYWARFSSLYGASGVSDNVEIRNGVVVKARNLATYHSNSTVHKLNNKFAADEEDTSRGSYNCTIEATPLVIDLALPSAGTEISKARWVEFDLNGDGVNERTAWTHSETQALLAIDLDHSGCIENGQELFGEYSGGMLFENGFQALVRFDQNGDGQINEADSVFEHLRLWQNRGDGYCRPSELHSLAEKGITALSLHYWKVDQYFDRAGSRVRFVSPARSTDGTRAIQDVFFKVISPLN